MASIFIRTVLIYAFLSISLKLMGKRQIGELEIGELVTTLVLSEVAALPIADPDMPLMNAIIPITLIVCLEIIISTVKNKSERLKKYIEGRPVFLIYKGKLRQDALEESRISINELLSEIRQLGIGDINEVYYALLEQNGKLSVFEKNSDSNFLHTVIVDAEVDDKVLKKLGYNHAWLKKRLDVHGVDEKEIFLMTVDDNGETYIIKKDRSNESV